MPVGYQASDNFFWDPIPDGGFKSDNRIVFHNSRFLLSPKQPVTNRGKTYMTSIISCFLSSASFRLMKNWIMTPEIAEIMPAMAR